MLKHGISKAVATLAMLSAAIAFGQSYPSRPIRILTSGAGGGNDFNSRVIAAGISGPLGQQVIVDNRATPQIAAEVVVKAQADGYTLLYNGSGFWLLPFLDDKVPFDPIKDFTPIVYAVSQPNLVVVHPSLPVNSIQELIAYGKAHPGVLSFATGSAGTTTWFAGAEFKARTGVEMENILYKAGSTQITDMISGRVQLAFINAAAVAPTLKAGKLKALAVTSSRPSALVPGVPTVAASGLPGYESVAPQGMFAPAGTPATAIALLNKEINRVLSQPETKQKLLGQGVDVIGSTPDEFRDFVKANMVQMGKIIKEAGLRGE